MWDLFDPHSAFGSLSGSSDAEGNKVTSDECSQELNHPINDLAWVRNELVEWVHFNLASKWDNIVRRGKKKVSQCC